MYTICATNFAGLCHLMPVAKKKKNCAKWKIYATHLEQQPPKK